MKLLDNLDSSYVPGNSIIQNFTDSSYFESGRGKEIIDLQKIDQDLLNAAIFFTVTKVRTKRKKTELKYEADLEFAAYNCTNYFHKSKFIFPKKTRLKYEKLLFQWALKTNRKENLLSANVGYFSLLDAPRRRSIRNESSTHGFFQWYYLDKEKNKVPVEFLTYDAFAEKVVKELSSGFNSSYFYSQSYNSMACFAEVDVSTKTKSKGPMVKVIQIVAGNRFSLTEE